MDECHVCCPGAICFSCGASRVKTMLIDGLQSFVSMGCMACNEHESSFDFQRWSDAVDELVKARRLTADEREQFSYMQILGVQLHNNCRVLKCLSPSCQSYVLDDNRYVLQQV